MSDFSKLLGQLQSSAKLAADTRISSSSSLKRSLTKSTNDTKNDQSKRSKVDHTTNDYSQYIPHDVNQLSIQLSFLGIGAQKAGTSWLHSMLGLHSQLSLPTQKEVHFWDWHRKKGLKWYSQQFPFSTKHKIHRGEITPCYAVLDEKYICEIKALFPNVKLIFLARELVPRAWSALLMELRNSVNGLEAGVFEASDNGSNSNSSRNKREMEKLEHQCNPNQYDDSYFMDRLMHSTHTSRCNYSKSLRLWLKHFPKEQLLIINYKDISNRPRSVLKQVCQHINADYESFLDCIDDEKLHERINVGKTKESIRPTLLKKMEDYLKHFTEDFNDLLAELGYTWKLRDDYDKAIK